MSEPVRIDELIRTVFPRLKLPEHLRPSDLLDEAVVPPKRVAEKVEALRAIVSSGGRPGPLTGKIASSREVDAFFRPKLASQLQEMLWVCGLDAKNRVRLVHCVSKGGVAGTVVEPRDVLRPLVLNAAVGALLVHNHPSGEPTPSPEDIALTERMARSCELLGVPLLDHVIVAAEGYFSFLDAGLLTAR